MQADPMVVQCGVGLPRSAPFTVEKLVHSKPRVTLEQVRDGPGQLVGEHRQCRARAMLVRQPRQECLAWGIGAQKQDCRFGTGPREIGMADLCARGAVAFARRCFGTLHEAPGRGTILPPWKAVHVLDVVQEHQASHLANPRHGWQTGEGVGVGWFCWAHARQLQVHQQLIVVVQPGQIHCDTFLHRRSGTTCSDPSAIRVVGNLFPDLGQVLLTVRMLDVAEQFRPFAHQRHPPPQSIAGGAHLRRIDLGLGQHTTAEQPGNLL